MAHDIAQIPSGFVQVHHSEFREFLQYQIRTHHEKEHVSIREGIVEWFISGCVIAMTRKQRGDTQAYFILSHQ